MAEKLPQKGSPSGIGKMISDGNTDLYKGIKSIGNSSYIGKYIIFFIWISLKQLFKKCVDFITCKSKMYDKN